MRAASLDSACVLLDEGAALLLLAEEAITPHGRLGQWLSQQDAWSDLPLLVMARTGADSIDLSNISDLYGNVTVLERPMRISGLVSAARSAIRARQRQYQIRDHLIEQEEVQKLLRANDRRKDEFLAILAHELRNPLAPVSNALDVLKLSKNPDDRTARLGKMMERQVKNLKRLVEDLLESSRISRGEVQLKKAPSDLGAILTTAIEASQPLFESGGIKLDAVLPISPIYLDADFVRLSQVFSNVLNNAAKYTDRGGQVTLNVSSSASEAVIRVKDNGSGIPHEMQEKIFELFTQVDQHLNRAQGGLGIGLTLVKRLITLHDGTVSVFSEGLDCGSEFTISLPIKQHEISSVIVPPDLIASDPLGQLNVLIVDDNKDAADSLGMLLELQGARTSVVYNGVAALEQLDHLNAQVAILDIGMQGMDGLTLARRIRARPKLKNMFLIALTGWGQDQHLSATKDAGFDVHLVKPIEIQTLEKLLATRFGIRVTGS